MNPGIISDICFLPHQPLEPVGAQSPGSKCGVVVCASHSHQVAALSIPRRSLECDYLSSGPPAHQVHLSSVYPCCFWA